MDVATTRRTTLQSIERERRGGELALIGRALAEKRERRSEYVVLFRLALESRERALAE